MTDREQGPMIYRNMSIDDYGGMIGLGRRCDGLLLRDSDSRAGIDKYLQRNPGTSFVAQLGDELVGTILAGHDGRRGYIMHVAVAKAHRCRGIGGRLLQLSLDALKGEGIEKAHVHVAAENRLGRDYWARRGFHHRGEIELYSFVNGDNANV